MQVGCEAIAHMYYGAVDLVSRKGEENMCSGAEHQKCSVMTDNFSKKHESSYRVRGN